MKLKLFLFVFIAFVLSSCQLFTGFFPVPCYDIDIPELKSIVNHYLGEGRESKALRSIGVWVEVNINYTEEDNDSWQTPIETYNRKAGDCEDLSILFSFLVHKYTGFKPISKIVKTKASYHMYSEIKDCYFLKYGYWDCKVVSVYDYDELLITAEYLR